MLARKKARELGQSTGYAVGYVTEESSYFGRDKGFFSSPKLAHWLRGPCSFLFNGYQGAFLPEVKWLVIEANHSSPSTAEVKNAWSYTSTPPYAFISCTGTTLLLLVPHGRTKVNRY
jgi:hypothetical protein